MENTSGKNVCICQICNCGRHKCPHQPLKRTDHGTCNVSEYTTKFSGKRAEPVVSCKPKECVTSSMDPLSNKTTHRVDYVAHMSSPPKNCKPEATYKVSGKKFDGVSTYLRDFTAKEGKKPELLKPVDEHQLAAKFDGEATYTADYRKWPLQHREKTGPQSEWIPPTIKFKANPIYKTDYVAHSVIPPSNFKPVHNVQSSSEPFDCISDYRDAYRFPLNAERTQPIKSESALQKSTVPMDHKSTHMHDYSWKCAAPMTSYKPIPVLATHDEPFTSQTTQRTDYREWQGYLRSVSCGPSQNVVQLQGDISTDTTYMKDYVCHKLEHPSHTNIRRLECEKKALPPFNATSDYRDSYRRWIVSRSDPAHKHEQYKPPKCPFDAKSTSQLSFVHYNNHRPAEIFKPPITSSLMKDAPMDTDTLYRLEYGPKQVEPCPAALLESNQSVYKFFEVAPTGHKLYRQETLTT